MKFASSASIEAHVIEILTDRIGIAVGMVDHGPSDWPTERVQILAGTERMNEEDPPVILVGFNSLGESENAGDYQAAACTAMLRVEAGALWDRGARDVVGVLLAAARIALLSHVSVTGWTDEQISPGDAATQRTLADGSALVHLKLPAGPVRGRALTPSAPITEATLTVERRPPDGQ